MQSGGDHQKRWEGLKLLQPGKNIWHAFYILSQEKNKLLILLKIKFETINCRDIIQATEKKYKYSGKLHTLVIILFLLPDQKMPQHSSNLHIQ